MQQQINLYKLLPRKQKSWLTRKKLFAVYGLLVFLIFAKFFSALWMKHHLTLENNSQSVLLTNEQQQLTKLLSQYPSIDLKNLQNAAENLRAELTNEEKIVELLAQSSRFSTYLEGLAQAVVPNVWLTEIQFAAKEPYIVLKGSALQPQQAQTFLDQLSQQSVFKPFPFKIGELTRVAFQQGSLINFNISTKKQNAND